MSQYPLVLRFIATFLMPSPVSAPSYLGQQKYEAELLRQRFSVALRNHFLVYQNWSRYFFGN